MPTFSRLRGFRGTALNFGQRRTYLKELINLADVITAPSGHLAKTLQNTGITNSIHVIQSGHDLTWLDMDIPKRPSERIRFGYIGQITPTKGLHILISAFQACDVAQNAELHIYGDVEKNLGYMQTLQSINGPNNDLITFHGSFLHKELGQVLAGIDILVVPSLWHENNPRVIQEAYAGKTPVIASDVGGIAEYVQDGSNGFLFKRGDSADLSRQINRIISQPTIIIQLISHLPEVKSIQNEMDEFESLYRSLLNQSEV
jgi:glycosyltransferase involved in cell wall biosynthesis